MLEAKHEAIKLLERQRTPTTGLKQTALLGEGCCWPGARVSAAAALMQAAARAQGNTML